MPRLYTFELNEDQLEEIVLAELKEAFQLADPKSVSLKEDKKFNKEIRKALKKVIKYYSPPDHWEYIDREYKI